MHVHVENHPSLEELLATEDLQAGVIRAIFDARERAELQEMVARGLRGSVAGKAQANEAAPGRQAARLRQ